MRMQGLILAFMAVPLHAQSVTVSDGPETVSLTVYRDGTRGDSPINKSWPGGYALITETRNVRIPAGESLVRFEGVAEGMFPESAIVTGLPKGVKEKNRDARLLSPSGLVDAYLKREVTITRTDGATGKVVSSSAMITAGPNGGVILQSDQGFEALRCTGLPERMGFGRVPEDLSAKPTLSVITQSDRETTAKLTLTYMASGFDWQANYVAQVRKSDPGAAFDASKIDVFAWLTLANGGNQSFANANTMAIAGEPNRERRGAQARPTGGALTLKCWPAQRTHQVPFRPGFRYVPPPPAPEASGYYADDEDGAMNIVVTASKMRRNMQEMAVPVAVVTAEQEDLGDLKLYRIPEPVTVNAKGQKQVAMIVNPGTSFKRIYSANVENASDQDGDSAPMTILLRSENKREKGLGLPMPSGQVAVFEDSRYGPLLAGESRLRDRAIGEDIEITVGTSSDVRFALTKISESKRRQRFRVKLTNARNETVAAEIEVPFQLYGKSPDMKKIDGVPTWKTTIAANGEALLYYDVRLEPESDD